MTAMRSHVVYAARDLWLAVATGLLLIATGCGSKLPVVAGTVTLDGEPLANATVMFLPLDELPEHETQPPAQGLTDAAGKYTLEQRAGSDGIQLGDYSVRITTYQPASRDVDPPIPAIRERVPVKYNLETELKAVVTADRSAEEEPFDFPLQSGGPIFQPPPETF